MWKGVAEGCFQTGCPKVSCPFSLLHTRVVTESIAPCRDAGFVVTHTAISSPSAGSRQKDNKGEELSEFFLSLLMKKKETSKYFVKSFLIGVLETGL